MIFNDLISDLVFLKFSNKSILSLISDMLFFRHFPIKPFVICISQIAKTRRLLFVFDKIWSKLHLIQFVLSSLFRCAGHNPVGSERLLLPDPGLSIRVGPLVETHPRLQRQEVDQHRNAIRRRSSSSGNTFLKILPTNYFFLFSLRDS